MTSENNYAFIDSQNLDKSIRSLNWRVDLKKFRQWLTDKFGVTKAYYFVGFIPSNSAFYALLQSWGYILIFKPTVIHGGRIKGNCDAELVLQAMIDFEDYDKAVVVTGDGDFACLLKHLQDKDKLRAVVSPTAKRCSTLITKSIRTELIFCAEHQRPKLEYKK